MGARASLFKAPAEERCPSDVGDCWAGPGGRLTRRASIPLDKAKGKKRDRAKGVNADEGDHGATGLDVPEKRQKH